MLSSSCVFVAAVSSPSDVLVEDFARETTVGFLDPRSVGRFSLTNRQIYNELATRGELKKARVLNDIDTLFRIVLNEPFRVDGQIKSHLEIAEEFESHLENVDTLQIDPVLLLEKWATFIGTVMIKLRLWDEIFGRNDDGLLSDEQQRAGEFIRSFLIGGFMEEDVIDDIIKFNHNRGQRKGIKDLIARRFEVRCWVREKRVLKSYILLVDRYAL